MEMELTEVKQFSAAPRSFPSCDFPPQQFVSSHSAPKLASSADFTALSFNGLLLLPDISSPIPSFEPDQRRLKRMISNRESARRSRLRKKKQIEELQGQVDHLRLTNSHISEKLIALLENNRQTLQENTVLKEKVSSLQAIVGYLKSEPSNHTNFSW